MMMIVRNIRLIFYLCCAVILFYTIPNSYKQVVIGIYEKSSKQRPTKTSEDLKYILLWNAANIRPFSFFSEGRSLFEKLSCPFTNCYVTSKRYYLADISQFDAVMFLSRTQDYKLPSKRSPKQKYIFASTESSDNYPHCNPRYNGFFNWTWTYRLDSDEQFGGVIVRDINGTVIGPKQEMHWSTDLKPIDEDLKKKFKKKTKAVAWFVSNCSAKKRIEVALQIDKELSKFNFSVDIFGGCGNHTCPRYDGKCMTMLEKDYFFYLSFENSFSEDYVTEKILTPLQHNTVPIVYGYANYTRFMPDGIYLDATKNSADRIAASIVAAIRKPEIYYNYFKWKNHYIFEKMSDHRDTNEFCKFCRNFNNRTAMEAHSVYENFTQWWNTKYRKTC